MIRNSIAILSLIFLVGCATTATPGINTVIQRVEIPIAVPCKVELPAAPDFNFNNLSPEDSIFDKVRAILADRELHLGYEIELLAALNSCIK